MKMNEMFPSDWLKGEEIKGKQIRAVISEAKLEEMPDGGFKPVLRFRNSKKGLVLNKTNGDTIAQVYGEDSDAWIGQTIVLYFDPNVTYAGKRTGGIRVSLADAQPTQPAPKPVEISDDSIPF